MSARLEDLYQPLRGALRDEQAVWSPQCPEPEILLDWIEQENAHPQAARLLEHLITCAYCRREYAQMRETWALATQESVLVTNSAPAQYPQIPTSPTIIEGLKDLPRRVAAWTRELIEEGIAQPVKAVRDSLTLIERLTAPSTRTFARSVAAPNDLYPAFTAIRSSSLTLYWSAVDKTEEYVVVVAHQKDSTSRRILWKGSAGLAAQVTLPEEAGLQPGGIYVWQVIARKGHEEYPSAFVGFTVLTEAVRQQVEKLEREVAHSALALTSLYEAHGLYEEALHQVETVLRLNPDDETTVAIQEKLYQQMRR